jgi:hypothetical protein
MTRFVRAWTEGVSDIVKFTPKGLAYSGPWGSLRHVGNAMFLLKAFAIGSPNAGDYDKVLFTFQHQGFSP